MSIFRTTTEKISSTLWFGYFSAKFQSQTNDELLATSDQTFVSGGAPVSANGSKPKISNYVEVASYRQGGVLIQLVLGTDPEARVVAAGCPGQLHRRLQVAVDLLVDGATKLRAVIPATKERCVKWCPTLPTLGEVDARWPSSHAGVQLEVPGLVSDSKVVLGQFGFGGVERQLVAGQPAFVAQHGGRVDGGARHVEVEVAAHVDKVALVGGLQLGALLAARDK